MIRRLHVQNVLSLKDATIDFSRFNIFIGPNASGKTAVFRTFMLLAQLLRRPLRGQYGDFAVAPGIDLDRVVWRGDDTLPLTVEVWFHDTPEGPPAYALEIRKVAQGWSVTRETFHLSNFEFDSGKTPFEHPTEFRGVIRWEPPYLGTLSTLVYRYRRDRAAAQVIAPILEPSQRIGQVWRYRVAAARVAEAVLPPVGESARVPGARFAPQEGEIYVREDGWGLVYVLQRLQGADRDLFGRIEKDFLEWHPHIKTVNFEPVGSGVRLAFITTRSAKLVPAMLESDGVLHTLFLLWRLHTAEPGLTICLEEPENGTHPHLLAKRYELLRRFAKQEGSNAFQQVLVATHSPDLLAAIEDTHEALDAVRIVEHSSEEGTKVHKLADSRQLRLLLKAFKGNVGDLWWSGAIGGIPQE
ncbi:MAG: AAA family ATPase [Chloroflexi bacterium]|nr:AAA family ATPase [Chloroflexota bacterium]